MLLLNRRFRSFSDAIPLCALLGTLTAGPAAADPVPPPRAQPKPKAKEEIPHCRGIQINGPDLTGTAVRVPPVCIPQPQLTGVQLAKGLSLDGKTLIKDAVVKEGGLATAQLSGAKLVGALLLGQNQSKEKPTVRLRIDAVESAPDVRPQTRENENADVWLYRLSVQLGEGSDPTDAAFSPRGPWTPLCSDGKLAVAVSGHWDFAVGQDGNGGKVSSDPREVTFACMGSAVAKCVTQMGYKPWKKAPLKTGGAPVSLDELHQTCVRAVRADYCGNGDSLTRAGEHVNFYDSFGLEKDDQTWPLEAMWTAAGAQCINSTRLKSAPADAATGRLEVVVREYIREHCPTRFSEKPCAKTLDGKPYLLWTETLGSKSEPKAAH